MSNVKDFLKRKDIVITPQRYLIEALGAGYIGDITGGVFGSNYQDVFAFIVLITVLVFRPSGIMGERVADRA